ncbi:MAG: protein translocase subunit SecD, partial [Gammaproteobacteria bacterium]
MNQYPLWKYLLIVAVLVVGLFFALPNIYGSNPAVQVKADRDAPIDQILEGRLVDGLKSLGMGALRVERDDRSLLLRFADENTQLKAKDYITGELGSQYVVALNLAPATPTWIDELGVLPMYLGLDLRGGVHFLMEVDMEGAIRLAEQRYAGDLRQMLREEKIRYAGITRRDTGGVLLRFRNNDTRQQAYDLVRRELPELDVTERDGAEHPELLIRLNQRAGDEVMRFALQQNITTLRNRVNELGVAEPVIQQQGSNRIVVQLPGVQDTAKAKEILGATATLQFRMVDTEHSVQEALAGRIPATARLYRESNGAPILLKRSVMLSGDYITDASSGLDSQTGTPAVFITLDGKGASLFSKRTRDKIGRPMA